MQESAERINTDTLRKQELEEKAKLLAEEKAKKEKEAAEAEAKAKKAQQEADKLEKKQAKSTEDKKKRQRAQQAAKIASEKKAAISAELVAACGAVQENAKKLEDANTDLTQAISSNNLSPKKDPSSVS